MNLATLCALGLLVATGGVLSCIKCSSSSNLYCTGSNVSCPKNDNCSSTYIEIITNGTKSTNFFRSCSSQNQCNVTGTGTFPGGSLRIATSCCSINDSCSPDPPKLPESQSSAQNGFLCRQCLSSNSDQCTSDNRMFCRGNEMCISFSNTVTGYQTAALAFQGCATNSICNLRNQLFTTEELTSVYNYACSGTLGLHHGTLIPLILFVLLLKLLL